MNLTIGDVIAIPRVALKKYNTFPCAYLYNSLNDQALLNATGCDHRAFTILLKKIILTTTPTHFIKRLELFVGRSAI